MAENAELGVTAICTGVGLQMRVGGRSNAAAGWMQRMLGHHHIGRASRGGKCSGSWGGARFSGSLTSVDGRSDRAGTITSLRGSAVAASGPLPPSDVACGSVASNATAIIRTVTLAPLIPALIPTLIVARPSERESEVANR